MHLNFILGLVNVMEKVYIVTQKNLAQSAATENDGGKHIESQGTFEFV